MLATSPAAKGALLLYSLPKSMTNIVDNLQTNADLTYEVAYQRLLDLGTSKVRDDSYYLYGPDLG